MMTALKTALAAAALSLAVVVFPAAAQPASLSIEAPWARPNLPNRPTAAYLVVTNAGEAGDRLVAAESPAFGAVEIHSVTMQGDVMAMQQVEGVEVPAGGAVAFAPGGFHLMLFDASRSFAEGESFPLTLVFEKAGRIEVEVAVHKRAPEGMHDGHGGGAGQGHAH